MTEDCQATNGQCRYGCAQHYTGDTCQGNCTLSDVLCSVIVILKKTLILIRKRFNDKVSSYVVNVLRNCDIYCCKMYSEKTKTIVLS